MLTARHIVLSAAVVMLLAGASHAQGAAAAKGLSLTPSAIQINPKRPNIVYASTLGDDTRPGGVFKSTNSGKTWRLANTGLTVPPQSPPGSQVRVDALALDVRSPNVLYAGTGLGVFKTIDGARTWTLASRGIDFGGDGLGHRLLEGFIWAIAIDPVHTSTVYAAGGGVWKSTNRGASWKRVLRNGAVNLGIDPRQPATVYASGMKRYGKKATRNSILKTVNGGDSWRATGPSGLHDGYFGHPIVVDPRAPGIIYAGGAAGLFTSRNNGRTWKLLSPGSAGRVDAIALDPARANVLYVGASQGLVTSGDGGRTWSEPKLGGRSVSAIAIAPTRLQTVYVGAYSGTEPGGMFVSTDGGATWHRLG